VKLRVKWREAAQRLLRFVLCLSWDPTHFWSWSSLERWSRWRQGWAIVEGVAREIAASFCSHTQQNRPHPSARGQRRPVTFVHTISLPLCLCHENVSSTTSWRCMEERRQELHAFLTSTLDGDGWSASRPGLFTPGERVHVYQLGRRLWWANCSMGGNFNNKLKVTISTHA
jgi:hypothetical protein